MAGESRPIIYVHQKLGDLDTRQQHAGLVDQELRRFRSRRAPQQFRLFDSLRFLKHLEGNLLDEIFCFFSIGKNVGSSEMGLEGIQTLPLFDYRDG